MSEEDRELELLKKKRLLEMEKNISQRKQFEQPKTEQKKSELLPRDLLVKQLGYRGLEVLQNAEAQFPNETKYVVEKLAELIRAGEITETIDGGKLLALFRSLGIRVRVQTTISVEQDGKMVSWSDKLKGEVKSEFQSESSIESPTQAPSDSTQSSDEQT